MYVTYQTLHVFYWKYTFEFKLFLRVEIKFGLKGF